MDIFKTDYIDKNFHGSMSIKKVQPILVPDLSYKVLDVQSGTMAVDTTERLFLEMKDEEEIEKYQKSSVKILWVGYLGNGKNIWGIKKTRFLNLVF